MEWLKKNWKNIVLLFFIVVICLLTISLSKSKNSLYNAETNMKALTDTIRSYKLENGELLTSKYGLIVEKEELTKYLEITEKEKKELEKKLNSSLAYIAELKTNVRIDTIHTIDSVFIDKNDVTNINFKYTDEWVYVDGSTKFKDIKDSKTTINTININTPLKVGLTEDNQFFAITPNPYVNISEIDGAKVLTKTTKPKRWGMGPTITIGLGYGCGTDFNGGNVKGGFVLGGFIGWSVHYSVWQW
jgi:hypothetical protein